MCPANYKNTKLSCLGVVYKITHDHKKKETTISLFYKKCLVQGGHRPGKYKNIEVSGNFQFCQPRIFKENLGKIEKKKVLFTNHGKLKKKLSNHTKICFCIYH